MRNSRVEKVREHTMNITPKDRSVGRNWLLPYLCDTLQTMEWWDTKSQLLHLLELKKQKQIPVELESNAKIARCLFRVWPSLNDLKRGSVIMNLK